MRISQLAKRSGVPATTLRYYESRGLLSARRSEAGYRLYGQDAVDQLAFIDAGKQLGLDLKEIAELLSVWQDGACAQVKASLRPRIAERITAARARTEELSAFTDVLRRALEHLDALPDRPGRCGPECGFPDLARRRPARTESAVLRPAGDAPAVACALDAGDMNERVGQWQAALRGAVRKPTPGGMHISLPADRAAQVAGLAAAEQRCCSFFFFTVTFDHDTVHMEVEAPEQAHQMLTDVFGEPDAARETGMTNTC